MNLSDSADLLLRSDAATQSVTERPGDPNFMASLARGLAVIRAFDAQTRRMTISQVSVRTGLSRAVVRRCLYTLEQLGYVLSASDGFCLAPRTLSLGDAYLSSTPVIAHAQPALDEVSALLQESSSLSILDNDEVLYLARAATQRIMSVALHVGSRLPAYCTSMGQVLLAALSESALLAYLERVPLSSIPATASPQGPSSSDCSRAFIAKASHSSISNSRSVCVPSPYRCLAHAAK